MRAILHRPETRPLSAALTGFVLGLAGVLLLTQALFGRDEAIESRLASLSRVPASASSEGDVVWRAHSNESGIALSRPTDLDVRTPTGADRRAIAKPEGTPGSGEISADSAAVLVSRLRDRRLRVPVDGVAPDELGDHFLDPRGDGRTHHAIDIMAEQSTPVLAVEGGTIAHTDVDQPGGGIVVYQYDSTGEFVYYYAHLERIADGLDAGDRVRPGQVIGYVGTTGNAPSGVPHLHFAIHKSRVDSRWWRGIPLNPFLVLR